MSRTLTLKDSSIPRNALPSDLRRAVSGARTAVVTQSTVSVPPPTASVPPLASYTHSTNQVLTVPSQSRANIALNASTAVIASDDVTLAPWKYTASVDETVSVDVAITGTSHANITSCLVAVRVEGRDVATAVATTPNMRLHAVVELTSGDEVTVEFRAHNSTVGASQTATVATVAVVVERA